MRPTRQTEIAKVSWEIGMNRAAQKLTEKENAVAETAVATTTGDDSGSDSVSESSDVSERHPIYALF